MRATGIFEKAQNILVRWHADPMSEAKAMDLRRSSQRLLETQIGRKRIYIAHIKLMCARYWLDEFSHYDFELMTRTLAATRRLQALLQLSYGQLLIARKRPEAFIYLDRGQQLADGLVRPEDYFTIYNRHQALRSLRLSKEGCPGLTLDELLTEAAVIDKFSQGPEEKMTFQPADFDTFIKKSWT